MSYTYEYPRPALAVDCVVFGFDPARRRAANKAARARERAGAQIAARDLKRIFRERFFASGFGCRDWRFFVSQM